MCKNESFVKSSNAAKVIKTDEMQVENFCLIFHPKLETLRHHIFG